MGYYLNGGKPCLPTFGKAKALVKDYDAKATLTPVWPPPEGKALVCVIENTFYDAAALMYSESELNQFKHDGTPRMRTWIVMDEKVAHKLSLFGEYEGLEESEA